MIDDTGWMGVGVYGSTLHQTPNIDQLATEEICFREGLHCELRLFSEVR